MHSSLLCPSPCCGHINPAVKASSSHQYKYKVSGGNIIHLITGVVLGLVLSCLVSVFTGKLLWFKTETSSYAPCHKINVNSGKADLVATLKKSTLPSNKCLLRAVYGRMQMMNLFESFMN
jgi:hypothetical protein